MANKTGPKSVIIVGGGVSGISTARVFTLYGFHVTVFEKQSGAGGVWVPSCTYPGLTTQNPKSTFHLPELEMPDGYPDRPYAHQVVQYLENYIDKFGLRDLFVFNTEVIKTYQDRSEEWHITTKNLLTNQVSTTKSDYLVICNGVYSIPKVPQIEGMSDFERSGGFVCHTSEYHSTEQTRDKHVLVVGYGRSACDVAVACDTAKSVSLIARTLYWKTRKHAHELFLTRFIENFNPYCRPSALNAFMNGIGSPIKNFILSCIKHWLIKKGGLEKVDLIPSKPLVAISLESPGFFKKIQTGEIKVYKNVSIDKLTEEKKAVLTDGTILDADIVICGTGWQQEIPFMEKYVTERIHDSHGDFRLYRNIYPTNVKNLGFNGYNNVLYTALTCELSAIWLAEVFTGGIRLPPESEMLKVIDSRLMFNRTRMGAKHARGTFIGAFTGYYTDELLGDMGERISWWQTVCQWLWTFDATYYVKLRDRIVARYEKERKQTFLNRNFH